MPRRFASILAFLLLSASLASATGVLHVAHLGDRFGFRLEGAELAGPWVLQHSADGVRWSEVAFFAGGENVGDPFVAEVPRGVLPDPEAPAGLFRAAVLDVDTTFLRQLVAQRAKWRLSGTTTYDYQLRQNFGLVFWRGRITVTDGIVSDSATIEQFPEGFDLSPFPAIEDLFQRIANAIHGQAERIDVTWDPDFGVPLSCYIDVSSLIADEESAWMVERFTP